MKLKTRLTIAFISLVLGSVILISAVLMTFLGIKTHSFQKEYGIDLYTSYMIGSLQTMSDSTASVMDKIHEMGSENADSLTEYSALVELNTELSMKLSYLLVVKDEQIIYQGDESVDWSEAMTLLQGYDSGQENIREYYVDQGMDTMIRQINVVFSDGDTGSVYICTPMSRVIPRFRTMLLQIILSVILVLIVTSLIMTVWIYNGVSRPVAKLRDAAMRITKGDYDFEITVDGDDELSGLCRDFEEMRKRLAESEAQKEKYDAESRELISNISHDLKTPITTVKGYVEGIMDGVADTPEKMDRYIKTIYNKANDMDRLINELTFYSKIDTNRIPYHFTKLQVAEFFDDCAEEEQLDLEDRGIRFVYENKVDPATMIIGDPEQLKRVIDNIVGNSVKYMDKPHGRIELRILDDGDFIKVEIEDNGKGIESHDLVNIFDRFYRTDASRSSTKGGSGIGLSIVKKIIEDHSGKIWASSTQGRGTTMHFVIRKYISVE